MRKLALFYLFCLLAPLAAAGNHENFDQMIEDLLAGSVEFIYPGELWSLMEEGEELYILDIRKREEYNISHIEGARFQNYFTFSPRKIEDIPRDSLVVLYCSVGYRSEKAGEKLLAAGYERVYNLYGGLFLWANENYPLFDNKGRTGRVHGYNKSWSRWLEREEVVY